MEGNPLNLCRSNKHGVLEIFKDIIVKAVQEGLTQAAIVKRLEGLDYTGTASNARQYISSVVREYGMEIAKYSNTCRQNGDEVDKKAKVDYITRKGIFNHLWMEIELTRWHHDQLWQRYPVLQEIELCIRQFREMFTKKNMPLLYLFIDRYKQSTIKELASFVNGFEKDLAAVENAVASPLSNGFVEGTNNKVKMVKEPCMGAVAKSFLLQN